MTNHTYITLAQAQKRVDVLTKNIEWLESIINEEVRGDLEINIEAPPEDVRGTLEKMFNDKVKERALFNDAIKYATNHVKIINIDGTTTKWNNNTPVWYDNE